MVARLNVRTTWLGKVGCAWHAWNLPGLKEHGLHKVEPKWTRRIMVRLMMMATRAADTRTRVLETLAKAATGHNTPMPRKEKGGTETTTNGGTMGNVVGASSGQYVGMARGSSAMVPTEVRAGMWGESKCLRVDG